MTVSRPTRLALALLTVAVLVAGALSLDPSPPPEPRKVEVPADGARRSGLGRFVVTARWGRTDGARATAPDRRDAAPALRWDGELRIDCGHIESALPLGMERAERPADGEDDADEQTVRVDGQGAVLPFRSTTREGWDGIRVVVQACRDAGDGGSTLTLVTAQKRFAARLDWSADDFVALPVGTAGDALEVHTAAALDPHTQDRSRVTERAGDELAMR